MNNSKQTGMAILAAMLLVAAFSSGLNYLTSSHQPTCALTIQTAQGTVTKYSAEYCKLKPTKKQNHG